MIKSTCTISFFKNDVQKTRLDKRLCPVKNCNTALLEAPYQKIRGKMRYLPFCPEHGLRIHKNTFVYYNGSSSEDKALSIRRNLMFHSNYYIESIPSSGGLKAETGRLDSESSEDAVTWNVFTELLASEKALAKLVNLITGRNYTGPIVLYLWGGKIDLAKNTFFPYKPLLKVRELIESDIRQFLTEPDIMLVIPEKLVICIEAKLGSKNPIADEKRQLSGRKPTKTADLIEKYYRKNTLINRDNILDLARIPKPFYEQLFRNIVFASSMAKIEGYADWYVANLRSRHIMNIKKGKPESSPIVRNIRSLLTPKFKKRFVHITWEDIFAKIIKDNPELVNLIWYLKNKTLNCQRAFNII